MEMPCVETAVVSFGKRSDLVPRDQFAWYRVLDHYLDEYGYWCDNVDLGLNRWVAHDDRIRCGLSPGQAYESKQRESDRVEYDGYLWAVFVNYSPRYVHLKGMSRKDGGGHEGGRG